jgi:diguanylate cyclase (GGDEF)-like protein
MISVLLLISIAISIILYGMYVKKARDEQNIKRIYNELHSGNGLDNVIKVLSKEISDMGITVLAFFKKNRGTMQLESEKDFLPILQHSSAVKALFAQTTQHSDHRYEVDKNLCTSLGENRLAFIPVRIKGEGHCWQINNCQDKQCKCHSSGRGPCWTQSEKNYRGDILGTYNEKTKRCLNCPVFLPLGVLAVKDTSTWALSRVHTFLDDNFSGALKNAVNFERALYSATTDHLTGIPNKRSLMISLRGLLKLSARHNEPLSFSMLDIDFFKKFNDTYGHQTGDFVLRGLAQLLYDSVRESDIVARYGGEEFSIIFPSTDKHTAFSVAEKIRKKVEEHVFKHGQRDLKITISMGISSFPEDDIDSITALIGKADAALYQSKKTRNRVTAYESRMSATTPKKERKELSMDPPKRSDSQAKVPSNTRKSKEGKQKPAENKGTIIIGID